MAVIKLSPSDLTFLWDECKRCFYLKIIHQFTRPSTPMPSIFTKIDELMKTYFEGKSASEFIPNLPPGIIQHGTKTVVSQPIKLAGHALDCYITGRFDTVVRFNDGSYGVVDFKNIHTKTRSPGFLWAPASCLYGCFGESCAWQALIQPNIQIRFARCRA